MEIRYLDGFRFRRALIAGANSVIRRQKQLDDINVYPVPDGDTGTNMAATLREVAERAQAVAGASLEELCATVADAALVGARGNSGAILAQFFQGLAEGLAGHPRAPAPAFAQAVDRAASWAAAAVAAPEEGTILTVIREWSASVTAACRRTSDYAALLRETLPPARAAVARTTGQLRALQDAGVVDAGAQGFVFLLEGVVHFIERGRLDHELEVCVPADLSGHAHLAHVPDAVGPRYCTECLLAAPPSGAPLDHAALRATLAGYGDAVVVAGSRRKVRLHLHTDVPRDVFDALSALGDVTGEKVDDMQQQHADAFGTTVHSVAVVVDSGCDLPEALAARHNIHRVPLRIHFGERAYIDGVTITPAEFYRRLQTEAVHPTTSQPAPADLERTYEQVARHYASAVSIHVPGRHSGTLQAARRAAARVDGRIDVVDGRSVSVGLGLVALEAARAVEAGLDHAGVLRRVETVVAGLRLYLSLETTAYVVRGGRMSRLQGLLARLVRLKPVLTFDEAGGLALVDQAVFGRSARQKVWRHVEREAAGRRALRFAVAHADAPEAAAWYADRIRSRFDPDDLIVTEVSPALGVHAGPGAAGVAFYGEALEAG